MDAEVIQVLVVDDEYEVRRGLAKWLSQRKFSVLTSPNLRSAVSTAVKHRPNVVLLDVKLGTEDGLQLVQLLRDAGLVMPCVVLTAHAGPYDGFRAHELGVVSLIEKPSSPDNIASTLRLAVAAAKQGPASEETGLRENRSAHQATQSPMDLWAHRHRFRRAMEHSEARFADPELSVTGLADHLGVTPEHLSRLFQNSVGTGPLMVINRLRTQKALQLLVDPRFGIGDVANLCGYRTTRQLDRWFRVFYGDSPSSRRSNLGGEDQEKPPNIN